MRAARSGVIINFSSIAAFQTAAGSAYYGAMKAALEALSDGLRKEVEPLGIRIMVVEPGPFKTDFAGRSLAIMENDLADYAETAGRRKFRDDPHTEWNLGDPQKAARVIASIVSRDKLPFRLLLGSDAVTLANEHLRSRLEEVERWREDSVSTDESFKED